MRRTILREVNPISVHAAKNDVIREQTQQVLPKLYRRGCMGRLCPPDRLCQQIRTFTTVIGLALLTGTTGVLIPQKGDRASAAESLINLTRIESPTTVVSPLISAANISENSIQPPKAAIKPLWVPKQPKVDELAGSKPVIARIYEDPTIDYQVQPKDTVEIIALNYQISEQELVKVNRLNNPNVIRVDQVLRIPSSQAEPGYAMGGDGSVSATTPSVITAAQPSGVTLPISTSQAASTPIPVAPTTDDSKFRVATVVTNQLQAPVSPADRSSASSLEPLRQRVSEPEAIQVASSNSQAEATVGSTSNVIANLSQRQTADLQSDIQKLQAKYSARGTSIQDNNLQAVAAKPLATTASTATITRQPQTQDSTPVASADQGNVTANSIAVVTADLSHKQTELQLNNQKSQDQYWPESAKVQESARTTIALMPKQKSTATVSAGPNFSTPIVKRTGFPQLLSPELPPLAPLDTYLPSENSPVPQRYIWPTKGALTSGYGRRWGRMHRGIDVAAPIGTPIVAAAVGVVVQAGWNSGGYGNLVNVLHPDGSLTRYAHNKKLLVRPGQEINQGQQIAEMGSTGRSTGPHLHFEIHSPGKGAVNPMSYLSRG